MLYRQDQSGVILISQPAHAWISGQIGRAWGNGLFQAVPEEVSLAAEQHDIGFLDWERSPTLNPATGLPHTFLNLPAHLHLDIWRLGVRHMLRFGRLPALLVSMHFTNIARQHWLENHPGQTDLTEAYLGEQEKLQNSLQTSLRNDFFYAPLCDASLVRSYQQLVSFWDWLSLLLCLGAGETRFMDGVPSKTGPLRMRFLPLNSEGSSASLDPWPFGRNEISLVCEGRRLLTTFTDEAQMRESVQGAAPVTLVFKLTACSAEQ